MPYLPNIKAIVAVVALVLMGLATTSAALATTIDMSVAASAMAESGPCMHHKSGDMMGKTHDCCQKGSGKHCPDDMDCDGVCNAVCAGAVFLTPAPVVALHSARASVYQRKDTQLFAFQTALNTPPPRS